MLRIFTSSSVGDAKGYYASGLEDGRDYYLKGESQTGLWFGKAAAMLGLSGEVTQEQFNLLCDNRRPDNFAKLNPRENLQKRRVGYDITFSAPKSVSILAGVVGAEKVVSVFRQAVREVMQHLEKDAHVRVRRGGLNENRQTGNLVWGEFTHFESRPIDGVTDVNLHCHCYTFNTSYDYVEKRFKAGEFFNIKRDAPYYEALFHSRLAEGLKSLGYAIENKPFGFEVAGIGEENIRHFSRRAKEIEQLASDLGISGNGKAMDKLAAITRQSKKQRLRGAEKLAEWRNRLDWSVLDLEQAHQQSITPENALELAIANMFERKSVVSLRRLIATALQNSIGDCTTNQILKEIRQRKAGDLVLSKKDGETLVTTHEIIAEEKAILEFLSKSKSSCFAMSPWYHVENEKLDDDQRKAVEAILQNSNAVIAIEGKAGTGKTTLMTEAISAMQSAGQNIFTFAPTSQAVEVLKKEGFEQSETIQQFLINAELQNQARNSVLWIDEAGLLSTREMRKLFDIAEKQKAWVILSGDRFQHHSVERGDAFRLVIESDEITVKQTRNIHRQRRDSYKQAIEFLSNGEVAEGIAMLDKMGAIVEIKDLSERLQAQADEYLRSMNDSVLAISPTHFEGRLLTSEIRSNLKQAGKLGDGGIEIPIHRSKNLTSSQKSMPQFYEIGDVVRFHQNAKGGFRKSEILRVVGKDKRNVFVKRGEDELKLDFRLATRFGLFEEKGIEISVGEKLRVTRNTKSKAGKRIFNGAVHEVTSIANDGDLILDGKHRVSSQAGIFDYGYVTTSHSSQGKTASKVIISQTSLSAEAASMEQFYVSASRGRDEITIFTDNKSALLENVGEPRQRKLAREIYQDIAMTIHDEIEPQLTRA